MCWLFMLSFCLTLTSDQASKLIGGEVMKKPGFVTNSYDDCNTTVFCVTWQPKFGYKVQTIVYYTMLYYCLLYYTIQYYTIQSVGEVVKNPWICHQLSATQLFPTTCNMKVSYLIFHLCCHFCMTSKSFLLVDEVLVTSFEHVERRHFSNDHFIVPLVSCFWKIIKKGPRLSNSIPTKGWKKTSAQNSPTWDQKTTIMLDGLDRFFKQASLDLVNPPISMFLWAIAHPVCIHFLLLSTNVIHI